MFYNPKAKMVQLSGKKSVKAPGSGGRH